jgi:DNA-binding NtrC family response regulator
MIVCDGPEIEPRHLPAVLRSAPSASARGAGGNDEPGLVTLAEMERLHVARVLRHTAGRRAEAARILGVSERHLYRKLAELDGT